MAHIADVAKYILDKKERITTWELQKLCYYCKAWSLALGEGEIFPEKFEAWKNGPVCYCLFKEHQKERYVTKADISRGDKANLSANEQDVINAVIEMYRSFDGDQLREQTHSELPWIEARGNLPDSANCNTLISEDLMRDYYRASDQYEEMEDLLMLQRAMRRESSPHAKMPLSEIIQLLDLTPEDIENAEDLEIEFE